MIFKSYDPRCDVNRLERLADELPEAEQGRDRSAPLRLRALPGADRTPRCRYSLVREARCLGAAGDDDPAGCGAVDELSLDFLDPPEMPGDRQARSVCRPQRHRPWRYGGGPQGVRPSAEPVRGDQGTGSSTRHKRGRPASGSPARSGRPPRSATSTSSRSTP